MCVCVSAFLSGENEICGMEKEQNDADVCNRFSFSDFDYLCRLSINNIDEKKKMEISFNFGGH